MGASISSAHPCVPLLRTITPPLLMLNMVHHTPHVLPSLPHYSLPSLSANIPFSASMSESSTRLSNFSSKHIMHKPLPFFRTDFSSRSHGDYCSRTSSEMLPFGPLSEQPGYIPILPRTSSASEMFEKICETCNASHDGSFGAGRFCSSRCARTVGGLAHRKKRLLERGARARLAAETRAKAKGYHGIVKTQRECSPLNDRMLISSSSAVTGITPSPPPRSMMNIGSLLNPSN